MLCSEKVASLEKLINLTGHQENFKKRKPYTTFSFHFHFVLPVKIAQYSFWQK